MKELSWQNLRSAILWVMALVAVFVYAYIAAVVETASNYNRLELVLAKDHDLVWHTLAVLLFAFLSLTLKGNANRMVNLIAGAVFALGALGAFIIGLTVNARGIYNPVLLAAVLLYGSIWWFALKTPKTSH